MTLVYELGTAATALSQPSTTKTPLTKVTTNRLPITLNIDNYLRQQQNFEAIPVGAPTVPKGMANYCEEWQAKFDAAGKKV